MKLVVTVRDLGAARRRFCRYEASKRRAAIMRYLGPSLFVLVVTCLITGTRYAQGGLSTGAALLIAVSGTLLAATVFYLGVLFVPLVEVIEERELSRER